MYQINPRYRMMVKAPFNVSLFSTACEGLRSISRVGCDTSYQPKATSSDTITVKPAAKNNTPISECFPCDISGISSSTTT